MRNSRMGKMLNLEIGKCYEIKYAWYVKKKKFYVANKTIHSEKTHSYLAVSPGNEKMSCDFGIYIWDKGYCYWSMDTGKSPSYSDDNITYCRELDKEETELLMKNMKNH